MHTYLRSIGYSKKKTQTEIESMIRLLVSHASIRETIKKKNNEGITVVDYTCMTSDTCGIKICGEEDESGELYVSHYFPFCLRVDDPEMRYEEEVYVNKRVDTDAYTGMCDDMNQGISMIFYIQNRIDYCHLFQEQHVLTGCGVRFCGLASEGKVILPIAESVLDKVRQTKEQENKDKLIKAAKQGDQEAMENLSMKDIDNYAQVSRRIKNEDILSIVSTSFYPSGSESDNYGIIGNILKVESEINRYNFEQIWRMQIECNSMIFDIAINKNDLLGEPAPGRRFKGKIWLQGRIDNPIVEQMFGQEQDNSEDK